MYPYEWTLETDCRGRSFYLPSPPNWQLGIRLKIRRPNTTIFNSYQLSVISYQLSVREGMVKSNLFTDAGSHSYGEIRG